jgi:predicted DsbA family dithiol-disulfide isomerase
LPFDLHPEYPETGLARERLIAKYGVPFHEQLARRFEQEGLLYNPHPELVPNTMRALQVNELARERGLHQPVHDRLMDAYWSEAQNIGDPEVIRALAIECGLDAVEVDDVLAGAPFRDRVQSSTTQAQSIGITGIPAYLLDSRLLVLGAQPRDVFERALSQLGR